MALIDRQAALDAFNVDMSGVSITISGRGAGKVYGYIKTVTDRIKALPPAQPTITHEQAIDYLHETGWLQRHDRILTESKVPLKGIWRDYTDDGYVECPFCKSATNCESKKDIDELHFCFSCGAMLKRGEADVDGI